LQNSQKKITFRQKKSTMKNINPLGLFDDHFILEKLTKLGDPLAKLSHFIDWEIFRITLEKAFSEETIEKSKGGRPPFDKLMMFKALSYKACIIFQMTNWNTKLLTGQVLNTS